MSQELETVRAQLVSLRGQLDSAVQRRDAALSRTVPSGFKQSTLNEYKAARAELEPEIARLELRELQLLDAMTAEERGRAEGEARVKAEDRAYWFRRFHTSLAIAHGGALAAIASKLLDKDVERVAVKVALVPMTFFSIGLVLAGLIPYTLALERRRTSQAAANISAGLFVGGLIATLIGLYALAFA